MQKRKHRRKVSRIIIFTTDAVDAKTRQLRIHPVVMGMVTLIVCCLFGALIGYMIYEGQIWEIDSARDAQREEAVLALEEEKTALEAEIEALNAKIEVLSAAVNEQSQTAGELQAQLEEQSLPTDYPLTGSAGIEEITEGDPMVVFNASDGSTVIASAKGVVLSVEDDENYGKCIVVDHGNGYQSVYRNGGEAQVKAGDEVAKGTTLFLVSENNKKLVYQITKDGSYINPMEMLSING